MATPAHERRGQLVERRERIAGIVTRGGAGPQLEGLLRDVDDALERLAAGTYGHCETCHESIEADRLDADPLLRFCLDHLSPIEARALEHDLELAASVQRTLLPPAHLIEHGWEMAYHYQPLGTVRATTVMPFGPPPRRETWCSSSGTFPARASRPRC